MWRVALPSGFADVDYIVFHIEFCFITGFISNVNKGYIIDDLVLSHLPIFTMSSTIFNCWHLRDTNLFTLHTRTESVWFSEVNISLYIVYIVLSWFV